MPWYVNSLFAAWEPSSIQGPITLLILIAVVVASFVMGGYLGKKLRMPDHGWKIGLCLVTLLISIDILVMGPALKLGIDLSGGAILVYEVDQSKKATSETLSTQQMDNLITAVGRRVNPGGQKEVTIRKYGAEQIEIIIPEKDAAQVERIEGIISRAGSLEFRILANTHDNKELIEQALIESSKMQIKDSAGNVRAWWVPVNPEEASRFANDPTIGHRERKQGGKNIVEVLVLSDIYNVTGAYLTSASTNTDSQTGKPCVDFAFNSVGAQLFRNLTSTHLPDAQGTFHYLLGIILDGDLYSAPAIRSTISDRGQITGNFTQEQVQDLVNVLNAGSLPAALTKEPISKLYTGPTLGADTIQQEHPGDDFRLHPRAVVHAVVLSFLRHGGQHRLVAEHVDLVRRDAGLQRGVYADRLRRPGLDGRHGGGQQHPRF